MRRAAARSSALPATASTTTRTASSSAPAGRSRATGRTRPATATEGRRRPTQSWRSIDAIYGDSSFITVRRVRRCVPDAVQRDARSASWCTADPGPPHTPTSGHTELLAVPGLQRTTLWVRAVRGPEAAALRPGHRRFLWPRQPDLLPELHHQGVGVRLRDRLAAALDRDQIHADLPHRIGRNDRPQLGSADELGLDLLAVEQDLVERPEPPAFDRQHV